MMKKTKSILMATVIGGVCVGFGAVPLSASDLPVRLPRISPRPATVSGVALPCLDLGGSWRFNPNPPADFASQRDCSVGTGWATIQVPGQWTQQGFTVDPKNAAGYWRQVAIPADWAGRRIKLRCDGVYSLATVWVNGREIGKHEGGFTPFELDVTDAVKPGSEATLAFSVCANSTADLYAKGTVYACHDLGGITRKIQLIALPTVNLAALHVKTTFDGGFEKAALEAEATVANDGTAPSAAVSGKLELRAPQASAEQMCAFGQFEVPVLAPGEAVTVKVRVPVTKPQLWDVEHPRLYTLTTQLGEGTAAETVINRVGFRKVEIRDKSLYVNNQEVKLRGICRHETHPLQGRSLRGDDWRKDLDLFMRANINFVRTSHYPPAEEFLDACDEAGMLVMCEAPFCWVGLRNINAAVVLSEVQEMVEFNRNHTSIVMWSLGNESQFGPAMQAAATWVRGTDPDRPMMFSFSEKSMDILPMASHHYPDTKAILRTTKDSKPVFFDEYAHLSDSNRRELLADPGIRDVWGYKLANLWEVMRSEHGSLGGAIWVAIDDIYFLPGGLTAGYGAWGVLDPWRRPKPEYWHVAKVYSPVRILDEKVPVPAPGQPIRLKVANRSDFADLSEMQFQWKLGNASGLAQVTGAPGQEGILEITPKADDLLGKPLEIHIVGPRGFEVDAYRFVIGEQAAAVAAPLRQPGKLKLKQKEGEILIQGEGFSYVMDATTGQFKSAQVAGQTLPLEGPCLTLVPMNRENGGDRKMNGQEPQVQPLWGLCSGWKANSVAASECAGKVVVKVSGTYEQASGEYELSCDGSGRLSVTWNFTTPKELDPRQLGVTFSVPRSCDRLEWQRKGQWNFYPEDHIGRLSGQTKAFPENLPCTLFGPRTKPTWPWSADTIPAFGCNDFRSTKLNILSATLCDSQGLGLRAVAAADRHAHVWIDGDHAFFSVLDYANDGCNEGMAPDRRGVPARVIAAGGAITGSAQVDLVGSGKR